MQCAQIYSKKIADIFDEDKNGVITRSEYYTVLKRYLVMREGDYLMEYRRSEKLVVKKVLHQLTLQCDDPAEIYDQIDRQQKGYITLRQLVDFVLGQESGFEMKEMDLFVFLRILDYGRQSVISRKVFTRHVQRLIDMSTRKEDAEENMFQFREQLQRVRLAPLQAIKQINHKKYKCLRLETVRLGV